MSSNITQSTGHTAVGFTQDQLRFLHSKPWIKSVRTLDGNPYLPGAIVVATLNAAFGFDGWDVEIDDVGETRFSPITVTTKDGPVTRYRVLHKIRVRLIAKLRDEHGRIVPGATVTKAGVGSHEGTCNSEHLLSKPVKNSQEAAYTLALRNAAILFGEVFGLKTMRVRKDDRGKPFDWKKFCSDDPPVPPNLAGIDVGEPDASGFDASRLTAEGLDDGDDAGDGDDGFVGDAGRVTTAQRPAGGGARKPADTGTFCPVCGVVDPRFCGRDGTLYCDATCELAGNGSAVKTDAAPPRAAASAVSAAPPAAEATGTAGGGEWTSPDGRDWAFRFRQPDGTICVRFSADPDSTARSLELKGATEIKRRRRRPEDQESGVLTMSGATNGGPPAAASGNGQGAQQAAAAPASNGDVPADRRGLVQGCRGFFRELTPVRFNPIFERVAAAHGFKEPVASFGKPADLGGPTDAFLVDFFKALRAAAQGG